MTTKQPSRPTTPTKSTAPAKVKALKAEADTAGNVEVELWGEKFTVHVGEFQRRMSEDYEFMELSSRGMIPAMLDVLVSAKTVNIMKEAARDPETKRVSVERMGELFQELMEEAGQGN